MKFIKIEFPKLFFSHPADRRPARRGDGTVAFAPDGRVILPPVGDEPVLYLDLRLSRSGRAWVAGRVIELPYRAHSSDAWSDDYYVIAQVGEEAVPAEEGQYLLLLKGAAVVVDKARVKMWGLTGHKSISVYSSRPVRKTLLTGPGGVGGYYKVEVE